MTPRNVIDEVRVLLNDTRSPYRYSMEDLLRFYNDVARRMLVLRPDIFAVGLSFGVNVNNYVQGDAPLSNNYYAILDFDSSRNFITGERAAMEEVPYEEFTRAKRLWINDDLGLPTKFARDPNLRTRVYVNPPPSSGVFLDGVFAYFPKLLTESMLDETMNAEDRHVIPQYAPALVDGIVFLAQSIDDEHISSGRAQLFYQSFINALGTAEQVVERRVGPLPDELRGEGNDAR